MPLYDLECAATGERFDRFIPLTRFDDPIMCQCGSRATRCLAAPRVVSDAIEPVRGPDGRMHTSLQSYRHACTPEGNPQGERYSELGDAEMPAFQKPKFDERKRRDAIRAGIQDVKEGRIPPVVTGDAP